MRFPKPHRSNLLYNQYLLLLLPPRPRAPNKLRVIMLAAVLPTCLTTELSSTCSRVDFSRFFDADVDDVDDEDLSAASASLSFNISYALSLSMI